MRNIFILLIFCCFISVNAVGQGHVVNPNLPPPKEKPKPNPKPDPKPKPRAIPKPTPKPNQKPNQKPDQKPDQKPNQNSSPNQESPVKPTPPEPVDTRERETINGVTVAWDNNATATEKNAVRSILNGMVYIPGGDFQMGSADADAFADEKPAHRESVAPFRLNRYEVTQEIWQAVMGNNPSTAAIGPEYPVETVTWNDCMDFINKLNRIAGVRFRLPSEAEWEYAARGGARSNGFRYSGSGSIDAVGWHKENSGGRTHPVGSKNANELGLYDMTGNVWEWTSDKYNNNYSASRGGNNYVCRGGSWDNDIKLNRVYVRFSMDPSLKNKRQGLRLAL